MLNDKLDKNWPKPGWFWLFLPWTHGVRTLPSYPSPYYGAITCHMLVTNNRFQKLFYTLMFLKGKAVLHPLWFSHDKYNMFNRGLTSDILRRKYGHGHNNFMSLFNFRNTTLKKDLESSVAVYIIFKVSLTDCSIQKHTWLGVGWGFWHTQTDK